MSKEYGYVTLAAILFGTIAVGGQFFISVGLSLFEVSFYRVLFISLILLPIVLIRREYMVSKDKIFFFAVYGLIGALLELAQFAGIAFGVPVAMVVILLYSQPIWTIPLSAWLLKEPVNRRKLVSVVVALLGIAILLGSWDIKSLDSATGVFCALIGGILLSLWIIWGRKSGICGQHYLTTAMGWSGFSVLWLLLLWPAAALLIENRAIIHMSTLSPADYWLEFFAFALIAGVVPHILFYRGMEKIEASVAGIILLLEPVSATLLAKILFNQPIGLNIICGGALILLSNYLVIRESQ